MITRSPNTPRKMDKQILKERFSERFSELLDVANFVEGRGRLTEISNFFAVGKSTAHYWLNGDICPKAQTLDVIVSMLIDQRRIPKTIDKVALTLWLEKGDRLLPNPLKAPPTEHQNHLHKSRIYMAVGEEAQRLGIDLFSLNAEMIEQIFSESFAGARQDKSGLTPDRALIRRILKASIKAIEQN